MQGRTWISVILLLAILVMPLGVLGEAGSEEPSAVQWHGYNLTIDLATDDPLYYPLEALDSDSEKYVMVHFVSDIPISVYEPKENLFLLREASGTEYMALFMIPEQLHHDAISGQNMPDNEQTSFFFTYILPIELDVATLTLEVIEEIDNPSIRTSLSLANVPNQGEGIDP